MTEVKVVGGSHDGRTISMSTECPIPSTILLERIATIKDESVEFVVGSDPSLADYEQYDLQFRVKGSRARLWHSDGDEVEPVYLLSGSSGEDFQRVN